MALNYNPFGNTGGSPLSRPTFQPSASPIQRTSNSPLDQVMDILGSKGGQTMVQAAGAGLQAYGASKAAADERAQNAHQFAANMAQRQAEADQNDARSRTIAATDADPLGANQSFAQKNAIIGSLLGGARNVSFTPGDSGVASAMGSHAGGFQLPGGGLDPAMLERMFGDASTQASIAQRAKEIGHIDPHAPVPDLAPMFGASADGSPNAFQADVQHSNQAALAQQDADHARQRDIIQRAIDEDIHGEKQKKHGNIFGKILKGASVATSFIPGVGQVLSPALSFAGGMASGDGLKSSAINAAMSAIPMGGGKVAGSAAKVGLKQIAKKAAMSPAMYSAILGG